jgi:hypothetical protein
MVMDTISKEEVDALAKSLLSYISHYNDVQRVGPPPAECAHAWLAAVLPAHGGGAHPLHTSPTLCMLPRTHTLPL